MTIYNPISRIIYTNGDYKINLGQHTNTHFGLTYDYGIFWGT